MAEIRAPKNAATVILLRRDGSGGFEVLMTRRAPQMQFLGGHYVFPGGSVKKEDCSEDLLNRCRGLNGDEARKIIGSDLTPELSLGHWVAGIRELFEEAGILLCTTETGSPLVMGRRSFMEGLAQKRTALIEGSMGFQMLLESEGLFCDVARLVYFSHWLTPVESPTRFDTRFYLALLPADQRLLPASQEVVHSLWVSPERALDLCQQGVLPVIFPTFASLRMLADFDSWESLTAEYGLV
ncbi:MAG: NUDIX hydrolase [Candidatus Binatia bacterium]